MSVFTSMIASKRRKEQAPGEILHEYISSNPQELHKGLLGGEYKDSLHISKDLHRQIAEEEVYKHVRNLTKEMQATLKQANKAIWKEERMKVETPMVELRDMKR